MNTKVELLSVVAAGLAPAIALLLGEYVDQRKRSGSEKPPQKERLLRPPGHSLALSLDKIHEKILSGFVNAFLFCSLSGAFVVMAAQLFQVAPRHWLTICSTAAAVLLAAASVWRTIWVFTQLKEMRNVRLGLRGEQAVAEALSEAGPEGFRSFHDLQLPDQDWNIDHVAVGPQGVFLIETKARRRRVSTNGKPEHIVVFDGKHLLFPDNHFESAPIDQAARNALSLAVFLEKKTGEAVTVDPVIVLPGWFVEAKVRDSRVKAMNANVLPNYLRARPRGRIEPKQFKRIVAALDERCRDVEFV